LGQVRYININCDVGEGAGNEGYLLPLISSCSIACGGHAGNEASMREVVRLALRHNVLIGAHPSYPDKENFGRISMAITEDELVSAVQNQIASLVMILSEEKATLNHIKPHGALYNDLAKNDKLSAVFLAAVSQYKDSAAIYVPYDSVLEKSAIANGFDIKREVFVDRNYNDDLSLVRRTDLNALISNPQNVLEHLTRMINKKKVRTIAETEIDLIADTYCLHGDTPNVLEILAYLNHHLPKTKIRIAK